MTAASLSAFLARSRALPVERARPKRYLDDHALRLHGIYRTARRLMPPGAEIVSVGPGRAHVEAALAAETGARVTAIDFAEMLAIYRDHYAALGIRPVAGNFLEETPPVPEAAFDGALFCEVLEHIPLPPADQFARLGRCLRPGGVLVLSTPNVASLDNVLALLAGRNVTTSAEALFAPVGAAHQHVHRREYVMEEVAEGLDRAGFEVIERRFLRLSRKKSFRGILKERVAMALRPALRPVILVAARRR